MKFMRDRWRGWNRPVANFRRSGPNVGWLHRADEGGVWFGHVYIYCPCLFTPRPR